MVESEVWIDSNVFRNASQEISFYAQVGLVLLSSELSAELDNELWELRILKDLGSHSLDQIFSHPLDILPVDHCWVKAHTASINKDQESSDLANWITHKLFYCDLDWRHLFLFFVWVG